MLGHQIANPQCRGRGLSETEVFSRAKILNVIASEFFNKRAGKKEVFPDVGEKPDLQLQVRLCCCFCKGWRVKSDTVSESRDWDTLK